MSISYSPCILSNYDKVQAQTLRGVGTYSSQLVINHGQLDVTVSWVYCKTLKVQIVSKSVITVNVL